MDKETIKALIVAGIICGLLGLNLLVNNSFRPKIIDKALVIDKEKPRSISLDLDDFSICYKVKLKIGNTTGSFSIPEKNYRKIKIGDIVRINYKVGRIFKDIFSLSVLDIKQ